MAEKAGFLRTAAEGGKLKIAGRGKIGLCKQVLHCPEASANLVPTGLIVMCGAKITIDKTSHGEESMFCHLTVKHPYGHEKIIVARKFSDLWWISVTELMDLLYRGGFSVEELNLFEMRAKEEVFMSSLALTGAEHKRRRNPDSNEECESDGDHVLGFESVKIRMNDLDNLWSSSDFWREKSKKFKKRHTDYSSRRNGHIKDDSVPTNAERIRQTVEEVRSANSKLRADCCLSRVAR